MRGVARSLFNVDYAGSPLAVCWFINLSCNAKCSFCCKASEIQSGANKFPPLNLKRAKELLVKIRKEVDMLYISGGEPTLHRDIVDILKEAKALKFSSVGMSSNLIALDKKPEILEYVDAISVSIHSPDPVIHARNLNVPVEVANKVFKNLEMLKKFSDNHDIKVLVNCVINLSNLDSVSGMLEFARERGVLLELVPANDNGRIPKDLHKNRDYIALIDNMLESRKRGEASFLAGSTHYYKTIRDFKPFRCFPYGVPNIMPDGRLCTPCDVSKQYNVNVLDCKDIGEAIRKSTNALGDYPCKSGKCFKAPIVERSRLFGLLLPSVR
ncbi:radical SAM protein [Thermodesulfobacteriota bacterium]